MEILVNKKIWEWWCDPRIYKMNEKLVNKKIWEWCPRIYKMNEILVIKKDLGVVPQKKEL